MPRISNEEIINIRNKVNIVDVISEYLPLVQRGKNYFAVCPFHDDHNPSMSISPERQIYTCFVCGASGNVFTFLMEYEKLDFIGAVKLIANKVGIMIDINSPKVKKDDEIDRLHIMYDLSNKFYQNALNTSQGKEAKYYLRSRNFTDEIIKEFEIGLSPFDNKLYKLLKEKGYSDDNLIESGLCNSNDKGAYDTFTNRIMFPLWDLNGKVVAFSGRIYNTDSQSKYVNTRETKIFKKGQLLYNYHRAKDEIRRSKKVIIVEGFMDVIGLYKVNVKNVIATMGTAITKGQAQLIKKLSSDVIICFDGDDAGNKATLSLVEELEKINITPQIIRLEDKLDPDDYINKKGLDKFLNHLENPMVLLDYKINVYQEGKNLNNPEELSSYINSIIKEMPSIDDPIVREVTIKRLSDMTKVSFDTLNDILNKELGPKQKIKTNEIPKMSIIEKTKNKYEIATQRMLFYMLSYPEIIRLYDKNDCFFPTEIYRSLGGEMLAFYNKYNYINAADFITHLAEDKELVEALGKIMNQGLPQEYSSEEIEDYIEVLNKYTVEMEKVRLIEEFKRENDPTNKMELAKKITDLRKESDSND
jgi:DNA primase